MVGKRLKCPRCPRSFKTKAALAQHERDAHGGQPTPRRVAQPRPVTRAVRPGGPGMGITLTKGTDFLGLGTVPSGRPANTLVFSQLISPASFRQTRLLGESRLWQRWRPRKLTIRTVGAGPMTAGGVYVVAWSPDPTPILESSVVNLTQVALACEKSQVVRFDQSCSFSVPTETAMRWLQTEGPDRDQAHGSVMIVLISPPSGIKGSVTLPMMLDWEVEWQGRKLELGASADSRIVPDSGYSNLFTTSDSSFDSTILTFKSHAGGSMVPFHQAHPGSIYTTSGTTTVVLYVDKDSQAQKCTWFSRVVGYEIPGLVLHSSQTEAQEYQRTGDKQHCLVYQSSGAYVTPARPEFRQISLASGGVVADLELRIAELTSQLQVFRLGQQQSSPASLMTEQGCGWIDLSPG